MGRKLFEITQLREAELRLDFVSLGILKRSYKRVCVCVCVCVCVYMSADMQVARIFVC